LHVELAHRNQVRGFDDEAAPKLNTETGKLSSEQELIRTEQCVGPVMDETLEGTGLVQVATDTMCVTKSKGPLKDGRTQKVGDLAGRLSGSIATFG